MTKKLMEFDGTVIDGDIVATDDKIFEELKKLQGKALKIVVYQR